MSLTRLLDMFQESEITGNPSDDDMDSYSSDDSDEHGVVIVKGNKTYICLFLPSRQGSLMSVGTDWHDGAIFLVILIRMCLRQCIMGKLASCYSVYYVIISFLKLLTISAMFSCELCFFWNQFNKPARKHDVICMLLFSS